MTASACNSYTIQRGDTLSQIGQWFGVPWTYLQQINHITDPDLIRPGQVIELSEDGQEVCSVYHVVQGDTLSAIGQHFGVRWQDLAHYNHITDPNRIGVGQVLCIPSHWHG